MTILYFLAVAIVLYMISDRLLTFVEVRRGRRFEQRSVIFFFIILFLSLATFWLIRHLGSA